MLAKHKGKKAQKQREQTDSPSRPSFPAPVPSHLYASFLASSTTSCKEQGPETWKRFLLDRDELHSRGAIWVNSQGTTVWKEKNGKSKDRDMNVNGNSPLQPGKDAERRQGDSERLQRWVGWWHTWRAQVLCHRVGWTLSTKVSTRNVRHNQVFVIKEMFLEILNQGNIHGKINK